MDKQDIISIIFKYLRYDERRLVSLVSRLHYHVFRNMFLHPEIFDVNTRSFPEIDRILSKWPNHKFKVDFSFDDNVSNIDFLAKYNNVHTLDIRYCNLVQDLSKFHKVPKITVSGNFNQEFCKLPNIKIIKNSYKRWSGTTTNHKIIAARSVQYSLNAINLPIPNGGWCNPIFSKNNNNQTEEQLMYKLCVYHDKIHERVLEIAYRFAEKNIKYHQEHLTQLNIPKQKHITVLANNIKNHIMKYFIGFGPGDKVIKSIFDLNENINDMYRSYIEGQFNDMIHMEISHHPY